MPTQEQERDEALNGYLQRLRKEAGLSLDQVCERTKIQTRYVQALEEGRFGELPSNTHLRAFSLALAQACGGDSERAALLVRRVLTAVAAPGAVAPLPVSAPRPAPKVEAPRPAARPLAPVPAVAASAVAAVPSAREVAAEAAEGLMEGASVRLKALPWQALLVLVGGAVLLSAGLMWGLERWQKRTVEIPLAVETPAPVKGAAEPAEATEAAVVSEGAEAAAAVAPTQLVLRARRPCWLVLQIDGQRLPTVLMQDGDKRSWPVKQKAVLLAGNIGALRVWWRGDNLAYLGELGAKANAVVFETGKAFRFDKGAALPPPAGVPE